MNDAALTVRFYDLLRILGTEKGTAMTAPGRKALKILAHVAVLAGLYVAFSFSMFLGLQIRPLYGNVGIAVTVVLAGVYIYYGILRKSRRTDLGEKAG